MEKKYMKDAIKLAKNGFGYVNPNPLTGAVIVKHGKVIGRGYHRKFGESHAEDIAIKNAEASVEGATIYVTLEPCFHSGKKTPCVDLIIENRIAGVVIGSVDPNPLVYGKSIEKLKNHDIKVTTGILADEIEDMNRYFRKYITEKQPYITMKTAMTMDGKTATREGDSKWISGEQSFWQQPTRSV